MSDFAIGGNSAARRIPEPASDMDSTLFYFEGDLSKKFCIFCKFLLQAVVLRGTCQSRQSPARYQCTKETDRALFKDAEDSDYVIATDETIFHPQGGGQPSDNGQMKLERDQSVSFDVKLVRKAAEGQIYHLGRFSGPGQLLREGDAVIQIIDTAKRRYHSRYHTAGHILGLAVRQLKEKIGDVSEVKANRAPGMAFVEFRGLISGGHKSDIQERVNELVQRNIPVNVDWWDEKKAKAHCAALPEGFSIPDDGDVRVVDVEGVGAYPCKGRIFLPPETLGRLL